MEQCDIYFVCKISAVILWLQRRWDGSALEFIHYLKKAPCICINVETYIVEYLQGEIKWYSRIFRVGGRGTFCNVWFTHSIVLNQMILSYWKYCMKCFSKGFSKVASKQKMRILSLWFPREGRDRNIQGTDENTHIINSSLHVRNFTILIDFFLFFFSQKHLVELEEIVFDSCVSHIMMV